jgi:hypothetical protein
MSEARLIASAKEICTADSLVGSESGWKIILDAARQKLDSVKAQLEVTTYQKLVQELDGYRVEWELLNRLFGTSCNDYQVCKLRADLRGDSTSDACQYERVEHSKEREKVRGLVEKTATFSARIPESNKALQPAR